MTLSHGVLPRRLSPEESAEISHRYFSKYPLSTHPRYLPLQISHTYELLGPQLFTNLQDASSYLMSESSPDLLAIEAHCQHPQCNPIPAHQDSFYHCIEGNYGIKLLVPLTPITAYRGGLLFYDNPSLFKTLPHSPSIEESFSASIPSKHLSNLSFPITKYNLELGDFGYHFLSSIHYSEGNRSIQPTVFLVFRFQSASVNPDPEMLQRYQACYEQHLHLLSSS